MKKRKGKGKTIMMVLGIITSIILILGLLIGNYFYTMALVPGADRSRIMESDHNKIERDEKAEAAAKANKLWFDNADYTTENISSTDGLKLNAYQLINENSSSRWAILAHGYTGQALQMMGNAKHFYEKGYNILMPDARGHGKSEGDYIGMGWPDRLDIIAWIDRILEMDAEAEIVLYGVSMGGATVMMVSGEDLPPNVKVIVEDCGYTSAKEEFAYQLKEAFGLPSFPIMNFASIVSKFRAGYALGEASAVNQLKKAKTPILFIHGTEDTFVPFKMLDIVYEAANVEKEKFVVEGAGHGGASSVAGDEYWEKIWDFTQKYID